MLLRVDGVDVPSLGQNSIASEFAAVMAVHYLRPARSIAGRPNSCGHPAAGKRGAGAIAFRSPAQSQTMAKIEFSGILRNGAKIAGFLRDLICVASLKQKELLFGLENDLGEIAKGVRCHQSSHAARTNVV